MSTSGRAASQIMNRRRDSKSGRSLNTGECLTVGASTHLAADTVIMLFREDYYTDNENTGLKDIVADLRIAKKRNGTTGMVKLRI